MQRLSLAVLLGVVSYTDAVKIAKKPYKYDQFGKGMPDFWNDFQSDPFFANTWRFAGLAGHVVSMTNETAYNDDAPTDYYFPTGGDQWEPDSLVFLGESIGEALEHHHTVPRNQEVSLIQQLGMTEAPTIELEDNSLLQTGWDNKPWKQSGYAWDQSTVNKHYQVADSHSYISPYDQRDHSWNDAQYNQSDEVKFFDNTKTLNADYLENTLTTAEYHLREGRAGVAAADEV